MTFERIEIGDAVLYRGDCLDVLPTLSKVDAVITDPPFGLGSKLSGGSWGATKRSAEVLVWDRAAPDLADIIQLADIAVVWGGNYFSFPPSRGWLTWFKADAPPSMAHFEMAWTNLDKNARQIPCTIAAMRESGERSGHPTQKPLAVMRASIAYAGTPQLILDPFMGSGTTGVAAIQMGCKFIGIEREQKYFDIAVERITNAQRQQTLFEPAPTMKQDALFGSAA